MFRAIFIAFIGIIVDALSNVVDSLLVNKAFKSVFSLMFFSSIFKIIFVLLFFAPFISISLPASDVQWYLIIIAFLDLLCLFPYYKALKTIDVSIVAALFSLSSILIPVMSYFLVGERLLVLQYIGFIIVILFSVLLSINKDSKLKFNSGFWWMLLSSIADCISIVLSKKVLTEISFSNFVFFSSILTFLIFGLALFLKKPRKDIVSSFNILKSHKYLFLSTEFFSIIAWISTMFALSIIPATVSAAIGSSQPIFALLFGIVLYHIFGNKFKEDISKKDVVKKILCFIMIAIGIMLTIKG